jgi:hypothetical protein
MNNWIVFVVDAIQIGFAIFTVVCLLCRWLGRDKVYREAVNIQSCVNFVLALGVVLTLYRIITDVYFHTNKASDWDNDQFVRTGYQVAFDTITLVRFGFIVIIGISFFFRRPRRSWVLSLLAFFILNGDYIIDWIGFRNDDYERMESIDRPFLECLWKLLLFATLVILFYIWQAKRKKLPYNSPN